MTIEGMPIHLRNAKEYDFTPHLWTYPSHGQSRVCGRCYLAEAGWDDEDYPIDPCKVAPYNWQAHLLKEGDVIDLEDYWAQSDDDEGLARWAEVNYAVVEAVEVVGVTLFITIAGAPSRIVTAPDREFPVVAVGPKH